MTYHIRSRHTKEILSFTLNIEGFKTVTDLMRFMMAYSDIFEHYESMDFEVITKETIEKVV